MRNKIAFDVLELVPNIISMKTWLVQLYVRDLSTGDTGDFRDYGLFTAIEQPDAKFLARHGLDPNGHLYKAEFFEFFRYPEDLLDTKDPGYKKSSFEYYLEIKAGSTNTKLLRMLDDVNNEKLDIDQVLDKHFHRDNYFTWLAVNILLGNFDTQTQNFYLYSPHDSLAWYFIPWDYDGAMEGSLAPQYDKDNNPVQLVGIANYWNSVLHARVFQNPAHVRALTSKIEELYGILSPATMARVAQKYRPVVEQYFVNNQEHEIQSIINCTTVNRQRYYQTLEKPMPVYLGDPEPLGDGGYIFDWSESCDLQGDRISYTLQVATDMDFNQIVLEKRRLTDTEFKVNLDPGYYYWRVLARDHKGHSQIPLDNLYRDDGIWHGLKEITVHD